MLTQAAIIPAVFVAGVYSWSYDKGLYGGISAVNISAPQEEFEIFTQALNNPNASTTAPVAVGHTYISLILKVAEFALPGVDTSIQDPQAVLTAYSLDWNQSHSFNQTFENPGPTCFTTLIGSFPDSINKNVQDDGNCTAALGEECLLGLQNVGTNCSFPWTTPEACKSAFSQTTAGASFTLSDNLTMTAPYNAFASNSDILSSSDSQKQYQNAATQMHFILFRDGSNPNVPVCVRATSAGVALRAHLWGYLLAALVLMWNLC